LNKNKEGKAVENGAIDEKVAANPETKKVKDPVDDKVCFLAVLFLR